MLGFSPVASTPLAVSSMRQPFGAVAVTLGTLTSTSTAAVSITGGTFSTLSPVFSTSSAGVALRGSVTQTLAALSITSVSKNIISGNVIGNILKYSEGFNAGNWNKPDGAYITANRWSSPLYTITAEWIRELDGSTGTHSVNQTATIIANSAYTASIYIANIGTRNFVEFYYGAGTTKVGLRVNLTTGAYTPITIGSPVQTFSPNVTAAPNGYWRLIVGGILDTTSTTATIEVYVDNGTTTNYGPGNNSNGLALWGAQLEQGQIASPYSVTETASSQALGNMSLDSVSRVAVQATLASTLENVSGVGQSQVIIQAGTNRTLANVTSSSSSAVAIVGSSTRTLGNVTVSSAAKLIISGSATATLNQVTASSASKNIIKGTTAVTLMGLAPTAIATVSIKANLARTLASISLESEAYARFYATTAGSRIVILTESKSRVISQRSNSRGLTLTQLKSRSVTLVAQPDIVSLTVLNQ